MSDINCPYCMACIEINHDDGAGYAEDEIHQQECPECDKIFVFTTQVHFYYSPAKADCLNGGDHKYKLTKTYPPEYARLRCDDCGDEKSNVHTNEGAKVTETASSTLPKVLGNPPA